MLSLTRLALLAVTTNAYRTDQRVSLHTHSGANESEVASQKDFQPPMHGIFLGTDRNGPLVPALVPPPGVTYEVENRERLDLIESNEYRWKFVSITHHGQIVPVDQWFATLQGSFFGNWLGRRRTVIHNNDGQPLFMLQSTKYVWNPTRWTYSFRIMDPNTEEILFTINKDWFGAGFLWLRDEWRVYRGRRRDRQRLYHVVGGYFGYGHKFYHRKRDWRRGVEPLAEASQSVGRDVVGLPDVFSLKVKPGQDTALFLATAVIIDMVHETEAHQRAAEAAAAADQADNDGRRRRGGWVG